jgi:hypothetical protein
MPRYKLLLIIILIFLLFSFALRSVSRTGFIKIPCLHQEQAAPLPGWLARAHRLSGPYAFDFIPLNLEEFADPNFDNSSDKTAPPPVKTYINPGGSPYPPGTLADMIWQQKQRDQRYTD